MSTKKYVVGFAFNKVMDKVLLIRKLKPKWFLSTSALRKEEILKLKDRPRSWCEDVSIRRIGGSLNNYTNKNSDSYDPVFDKKVRSLKPEWFRK